MSTSTAPGLKVASYARYRGPLVKALLYLKYRPETRLAAEMGSWLADCLADLDDAVDMIVPVPLAQERLKARGFNQAALLSQALSDRVHVPHQPSVLRRVQETPSQVGLTAQQRHRNVADCFLGRSESCAGKSILLVDDLLTTGATLSACAQALHASGASRVFALTVGRAGSFH
jgi:ComF family protein